MNKKILFAALFLAALSIGFIACDNDDDPRLDNDDDNTENVVDDDSTDIDSDSIDNIEGEDDYYNCDSTEMVCTGKAYDITTTTAKVAATVHIPLTLLAQCKLGVQVSSSKEDLIAHENVTNFTTKDLTGNDFVVNLKNLKSGATTYYYCAYIYLNGIYHYGLIREFKTFCVLTTKQGFYTYSGEEGWMYDNDCIVDGAGEYAPGSKVTLSATLDVDWFFCFWSDCDSKELKRTITITSDTTIRANFKRKPYLSLFSNENGYGDVTGKGCYDVGAEATITATPKGNYYFTSWSDGNTENPRTVVVNSDTTFTANFTLKPYLTVKSNNTFYGTVTGSGYYMPGDEVTITATPKLGVEFVKWNDENTDNPRVVTVTSDMTYTATFVAVPNGSENGYEWIDLGLSVKWATCNVGATKTEEYGDYFAWGETTPKSTYDWSTYKWCNGSSTTLTKYCTYSDYGTVDNKTVLDLEDDAARANWGGAWRMPTYAEWLDLINNCTWTWTTYNGVYGYRITSNFNGNFIFLPAAGYRFSTTLWNAGSHGSYWSSSLYASRDARYVYFGSDDVSRGYHDRYYGLSVRPVLGE